MRKCLDERRLRLVAEDHVLPERRVQHQPVAMSVLGDVAESLLATVAGAELGDVLALELDRPGRGGLDPDDHVDQLVLPVALHAGDAHDLPAVDLEADLAQRGPARLVDAHIGQGECDVLARRLGLGLGRGKLADPTISSASSRARHVLGQHLGHGATGADDGDRVGDRQHLVQLVGDEDHRHPTGHQLAQRGEELVDLLGHEDGGRLVEDDDAGAAVEHLQDLDPLAFAHAELAR